MKSFANWLVTLTFIVMITIPAGHLLGQTNACGDLSEADCTLLMAGSASLQDLSSTDASFNLSLLIEPAAGRDETPFTLDFGGSGQLMLSSDPTGTLLAPSPAALQDESALAELVVNTVGQLDAALSTTFSMGGDPFTFDEMEADTVLVDGVLYINTADLRQSDDETDTWVGIELADILGSILTPQSEGNTLDLLVSTTGTITATVERGSDETLGDQSVAVFAWRVDLDGAATHRNELAIVQKIGLEDMQMRAVEVQLTRDGRVIADDAETTVVVSLTMTINNTDPVTAIEPPAEPNIFPSENLTSLIETIAVSSGE